jgi:class 3 adenylate cyclase
MQALSAQTHVVLALAAPVFQETSVTTRGVPEWDAIYQRVLANASSVRVANEHSSKGDATAFEYTTRLLIGLAQLRARQLETELRAIALWDGAPGDGSGGTAWAIEHLQEMGVPLENLWEPPSGAAELSPPDDGIEHPPSRYLSAARDRTICAMLFSDVKGYSKLREEEIFDFSQQFLAGVARLIAESEDPPIARNTWGDGLFLVFADVRAAGRFAVQLSDAVRLRAAKLGLPTGVAIRIGLHAGPIYPLNDPVTARQTFVGVNVALTARIEPIVVENQVFASEAFAALCAADGLADFQFEYLGSTELAKSFGRVPLFQLHLSGQEGGKT